MKLTKNQKHFLKTIKNKSNRKYQKQQFKLQNEFENRQIIKQFPFPIVDISFKEEFEKINGKGFPWYKHSTKEAEERFNELVKNQMQSDFGSANLSDLQIEKVVEWMNTWEQLKDTAIPIRFKEDFRIKKQ